jgi:hypothetical protein
MNGRIIFIYGRELEKVSDLCAVCIIQTFELSRCLMTSFICPNQAISSVFHKQNESYNSRQLSPVQCHTMWLVPNRMRFTYWLNDRIIKWLVLKEVKNSLVSGKHVTKSGQQVGVWRESWGSHDVKTCGCCGLEGRYQRLGGTYYLHLQGWSVLLRSVGIYMKVFAALLPRRRQRQVRVYRLYQCFVTGGTRTPRAFLGKTSIAVHQWTAKQFWVDRQSFKQEDYIYCLEKVQINK